MSVRNVINMIERKKVFRVLFFVALMTILFSTYALCIYGIEKKRDTEREEKKYDNIFAEITDIKAEKENLEILGWISYKGAESKAVKVAVRNPGEANISIYPCEMASNREIEAYYNVKDGDCSIFWTENSIVYNLFGNLDENELIEIATKLKISEK